MISDTAHQPDTLQQSSRSFKSLKLLILIAAILLCTLVAGTGGYWLGQNPMMNKVNDEQRATSATQTIVQSSTPPIKTKNWKTYTSPKGYAVRYPFDMEHEELGGYPFDLRIRSEDLTMTFIPQALPNDRKAEELVTIPLCDDRPNKIKEEKINNLLIYRVEKTLSNNELCLLAVIYLNTFLIIPSLPQSQWTLEILGYGTNRYSAKLFNDILSTVRLTH